MDLFVEMKRRGCSGALGHKEAKPHGSLKLEVGGWDIRQSKETGTVFNGNLYCKVYFNGKLLLCKCPAILKYNQLLMTVYLLLWINELTTTQTRTHSSFLFDK